LGKILRIDVNSSGGVPPDCGESASQYTIPSNNPFVDGLAGKCDEIWATGLRNPWRFSFDPLTNDMFITDVGEWDREEVNFWSAGAPGGVNYGWHCYEGSLDYTVEYPEIAPHCGSADLYTFPIFEYGGGCSIIGGFMYRGSQYASLYGHYLLADFCSGQMWLLYLDNSNNWVSLPAGNTGLFVSAFGQGVDGELYAGTWLPSQGDNKIYHVVVP
jgi:glucose/arabinose dehydrogenase